MKDSNRGLYLFLLSAFALSNSKERKYDIEYIPFISEQEIRDRLPDTFIERNIADGSVRGFLLRDSCDSVCGFSFRKKYIGLSIAEFQKALLD